jgi:penicillin-insensitive murein endopeptidase
MIKFLIPKLMTCAAVFMAAAGLAGTLHHAGADEVLPWQNSAAKAAAAAADRAKSAEAASKPVASEAAAKQAAASPEAKTTAETEEAKAPPLVPAKKLFGAVKTAIPLKARAIGFYSKGCLAGGKALPIDGPAWQAMRLSRNRNWGHPKLIALLERFAKEAQAEDGWPGLLVGDLSQPRGGPMLTGHSSHQVGLDADIWFTPMPSRKLSRKERENLSATSMLASDNLSVNPKVWGEGQVKIVRRVASYPQIERVLVHPAIKKALCGCWTAAGLARQGASVLGTLLSFPRSHGLPQGLGRLQEPGACFRRRRLWQGTGLLVQTSDGAAQTEAKAYKAGQAREAQAANHAR